MEKKTLGLLEIAAGALIYRSFAAKSSFKPLVNPEMDFVMKAGGNAVSVLIATRGFEQLGCSENASWGLVVGSVIAYEWFKFRDTASAVARGEFAGNGVVLPPPPSKHPAPVTYTPACMPGAVTYTPAPMSTTVPYVTHNDFGPGF